MKTKLALKLTCFCLLPSAFCLSTFSQGTAFTYQGRLDEGGLPVNGSYDLTFIVWNAASGGAQAGETLTNANTAVSNGLFTVTLDFGAGGVFGGPNRWLEIGVRTNGGGAFSTLSPRQPITSTPYAIRSANAASAVSVSGSVAAAQLTGTISSNNLGTGSITATMLASGAVGSNQLAAGAVTSVALADGAVIAPKMATVSNWFALTIPNPSPAVNEDFGRAFAFVGSSRVLLCARNQANGIGEAYLFDTNGTLVTTITNPTPAVNEFFGHAAVALGGDRIVLGSLLDNAGGSDFGAAYVYSTNGTLLTTITNPTPAAADFFGIALAVLGTDRILVSASQDDTGAMDAGAVYLFNTNGTLLTTFTNPTPAIGDTFGETIAVVGNNRVLISARLDDTGASNAGTAYLFNTNGGLILAITNPTPAIDDFFGDSVTGVGSDRLIIGATGDDTATTNAGAAYLFGTNGALMVTLTNPAARPLDRFGAACALVGTDRVIIGAYRDSAVVTNGGAAYLFNLNGSLLATFPNPTPASGDDFGLAVGASGNRLLIGARFDDLFTTDDGVIYLYHLESFADGLVPAALHARTVDTASLDDGAVTLEKLDPTIGVWTRSSNNVYRLFGNVGIGTANPTNRLHVIGGVSATTFITTSDRNAKEHFARVSPTEILAKVTTLPISTWSFKDLPGATHMGPMAQDFYATFGLGNSESTITTVDLDGVALAAIQGLNQKVEVRMQNAEVRNRRLEEKLEQKETEIMELKQRLDTLERTMSRNHGNR